MSMTNTVLRTLFFVRCVFQRIVKLKLKFSRVLELKLEYAM